MSCSRSAPFAIIALGMRRSVTPVPTGWVVTTFPSMACRSLLSNSTSAFESAGAGGGGADLGGASAALAQLGPELGAALIQAGFPGAEHKGALRSVTRPAP